MDILAKIHVNPRLDTPLVVQIKEQLAWLIASGQIQPGERLPAVRRAAERLGVNLHTVRSAYQKLEADGLVETHQGMATKVLPYDTARLAHMANALPSHTVGVIIPSVTNPFYHPLLQGIETVASKNRTMMFVCVTHDDHEELRRSYAQLAAKNVDGVLLASQDDSPFIARSAQNPEGKTTGLPFVAVDWPGSLGYAVTMNLENAGYLATRHLLEHGHRRVGLITYAMGHSNVAPINRGYQRALLEHGIDGNPGWIVPVHGYDAVAGAEGAQMLLATDRMPTAIFAISDLLAIGAMRAFQQAGMQIPKDIAVVGFNDIPLAEMVSPPLTTVYAPAYEMGLEAMKMLQSLISGKQPAVRHVILPTRLVARQSCGC